MNGEGSVPLFDAAEGGFTVRLLRLLVLALVALPVFLAPPAAAAEIVLTTDARGALFSDGQLTPDYRGSRCIEVRWTGNAMPRLLGVASKVSGDLAPYLVLEIEVGTGGGFSGCGAFVGQRVYRGPLSNFGVMHPNSDAQIMARRITAEAGAVTFRITASVLDVNEAQSKIANADFVFAALDEARLPVLPSPPSAPPTDAVPSVPLTTPSPTAEPKDDEEAAVPAGLVPRRQGNAPPEKSSGPDAAAPAVTVPLTPGAEADGILTSPFRTVLNLVDGARHVVQQAAAPVMKGVAWSAWSLPALLLFLLLQNYFDARDPKLAEAPVFSEVTLPFDDGYPSSTSPEAPE